MDCELIVFHRYRNRDDTVDVTLKLPGEENLSGSIEVKVDPAVSPFIKFDPDGTNYQVRGKIISVTRWRIELEDATIAKPEQSPESPVILEARAGPAHEEPVFSSLARILESVPKGF